MSIFDIVFIVHILTRKSQVWMSRWAGHQLIPVKTDRLDSMIFLGSPQQYNYRKSCKKQHISFTKKQSLWQTINNRFFLPSKRLYFYYLHIIPDLSVYAKYSYENGRSLLSAHHPYKICEVKGFKYNQISKKGKMFSLPILRKQNWLVSTPASIGVNKFHGNFQKQLN